MIVDSSAVLAVLLHETDARRYAGAIMTATPCRMSVANALEASFVVESRGGSAAGHELDVFLEHAGMSWRGHGGTHGGGTAGLAAVRQGQSPAALNYGDWRLCARRRRRRASPVQGRGLLADRRRSRMSVKAERSSMTRCVHAAGGPSAREALAASRAPCKETQ